MTKWYSQKSMNNVLFPVIKTYFIEKRKRPVQVGPLSPSSPKEKTAGENVENIKIAMDEKEDTQVRKILVKRHLRIVLQHLCSSLINVP